MQSTVANVNQFATQLAGYNQQIMNGDRNDAGLDAQIHSTLDQLSNDGSISATQQSDGTWTVLLNGQTPLVIEEQAYALSTGTVAPSATSANPNGPPHLSLLAADGTDITADTTSGQLGSLLNTANTVLPSYLGDGNQAGSLNILAQSFASNVNSLLTSGYQSDGPPPVRRRPVVHLRHHQRHQRGAKPASELHDHARSVGRHQPRAARGFERRRPGVVPTGRSNLRQRRNRRSQLHSILCRHGLQCRHPAG